MASKKKNIFPNRHSLIDNIIISLLFATSPSNKNFILNKIYSDNIFLNMTTIKKHNL